MSELRRLKSDGANGETRSVWRRLRSNVFGYGYYQVVTIVVQLVLVPFYLKFWGTKLYADWLVLSGIPTMLLLLDFGVGQATANKATGGFSDLSPCGLAGAGGVCRPRSHSHFSPAR